MPIAELLLLTGRALASPITLMIENYWIMLTTLSELRITLILTTFRWQDFLVVVPMRFQLPSRFQKGFSQLLSSAVWGRWIFANVRRTMRCSSRSRRLQYESWLLCSYIELPPKSPLL